MTRNVLLISAGIFHPPLLGRFWLRRMLSNLSGYSILQMTSMESLPQLDLEYFDGMILNIHHKIITEQALQAFDDYVSAGGGVLAMHATTASFKHTTRFFEILGGQFSSHGPVETFQVMPSRSTDDIFGQLAGFTCKDELYLHDLSDDIRVHYYTNHQDEPVPMVWTRLHADGRVCYTCPGHRSATLRIPAYQAILKRGLQWVCGG
jgi:type 1 glutamine amidotransferase